MAQGQQALDAEGEHIFLSGKVASVCAGVGRALLPATCSPERFLSFSLFS